jgi:large subunit ribosomal protein L5
MKFEEFYKTEVKKTLLNNLGKKNIMSVPEVKKIVVNVGAGEAVENKAVLEKIQEQLSLICGQKPIVTKARKSVSAFKIRKGYPIGVKVTLRGKNMYFFLEKLIKIILPRLKDFRGVSENNLDKYGNLNLGLTEQIIFPEIEYDKIDKIRGLQITIVTGTKNKEEGKKLFKALGVPFNN